MSKRNQAHSTFERLRNYARSNNEDFNLLLTRYAMERFLYRLSISEYSNQFILKGASLFLVWQGHNHRVTRDVDFLYSSLPDGIDFSEIFKELAGYDTISEDGMKYLPDSIKVIDIREDKSYHGVRITLSGILGSARIPLQFDIGFGDIITPEAEHIAYPTILDNLPPKLSAYPKYTMVAEKFETMISLGIANSRMKDFYDIWLITQLFEFDHEILSEAIRNTFKRRKTELPQATPYVFTKEFCKTKQPNWEAFIKKSCPDNTEIDFSIIINQITNYLKDCY